MKKVLLLFIIISCSLFSQTSNFTNKVEREKFKNDMISFIYSTISKPVIVANENDWKKALWGIELIQLKNDTVFNALKSVLNNMEKMNDDFKRLAMETVFGLYRKEFRSEFEKYIMTYNPKIFGIIANYFIQSCADKKIEKENLFAFMEDNYKYYWSNPICFSLSKDFDTVVYKLPILKDLLTHNFGNKPVIFSFQRKNREYPGLTIIRNAEGKFLREENGKLFSVPQLAMAVSNLPSYITNGNTPEGIYSIQDISTSNNEFIGPNPVIVTALPYEVPVAKFLHNADTSQWDLTTYQNLLPKSWVKYYPIFKAFYAGKVGRSEIIIHGTTIDHEYYKTKPYYPFTPSLGCVTSKELWDENGNLIESGQLKLVNKLKTLNDYKGYFILFDLDDKESPVSQDEIEKIIAQISK